MDADAPNRCSQPRRRMEVACIEAHLCFYDEAAGGGVDSVSLFSYFQFLTRQITRGGAYSILPSFRHTNHTHAARFWKHL